VFTLARDRGLSEVRESAFADSYLGELSSASPDSVGPQGVRPVDMGTIGSRRCRTKNEKKIRIQPGVVDGKHDSRLIMKRCSVSVIK
jgi:hypothetical protein